MDRRYFLYFAIVFTLGTFFFVYTLVYRLPVSHDGMVWIPSGKFLMGSNTRLSKLNEQPAHQVRVDGFWMDKTDVTNAQFVKFIEATGYITTAERKPSWETLSVQLPEGTPKPPDEKLIPGAMSLSSFPLKFSRVANFITLLSVFFRSDQQVRYQC